MPLVVPGLMNSGGSNSNNQQDDWMNKLVGKKLTDSASDNMVRFSDTGKVAGGADVDEELRKAGSTQGA